ncbi:MAG: SpoIIE family protein phosphatase [Verrucomicrobiota bacterium]|nr:SpoIIE family protein phosphatase [Verrucomicrobiota bacterium]
MKGKEDLLLKNLMDSMSDMIYFKDIDSRFIMMNKSSARWQGFSRPDDSVGSSDFDRYQEDDARRMLEEEQRIVRTGEPMVGIEEQETRKNGQRMWVSTTKMPLKDGDGKIIGTFGISRDITAHKEAEQRTARYAEEVRRIKEEMEEEVRMAGELQKNFFPAGYPVFPEGAPEGEGCLEILHRVALNRQVTGDYCSIMRLSENEVGFFLCDVCGVGVRAALGTALIRGIMQEIASLGREPGAYLARMNELLAPLLHQEGLLLDVTACYLVLDVGTGRIRLANAGHPMPLLFRDGSAAQWLCEGTTCVGTPLAADPGAVYETVERQISPGDSLVLFTDGLYSTESNAADPYGKKRLIDSAHSLADEPLSDIFQGLEDDALAFSMNGKFSDDVCLVGFHLRKLME